MKNSEKQVANTDYLVCLYDVCTLPQVQVEKPIQQVQAGTTQLVNARDEPAESYELGWRGAGWIMTIPNKE